MRPRRLALAGFGPFADLVELDFTDVDLFALVGPTGAGKSTVIDAMCFALYGSVPRYDDRRAVGPVVHSLASEARVAFTFEMGGTEYVAVRVVRRDAKGRATTRDARLEVVGGAVRAGTTKEMDAAVAELLGLDFDQFTRAVVLPQGEFARFLHDKPAARQDLLAQLLGLDVYERIGQRARAIAAETGARVVAERERLAALEAATPAVRQTLTDRIDALRAADAAWRAMEPELAAAEAGVAAAATEVQAAVGRAEALDATAVPDGVGDDTAAATAARDTLAAATDGLAAAATARASAEAALAAAGDAGDLTVVQDAWRTRAELATRAEAERAALARAERLAVETAATREAAETALDEIRAANAAVVVREHLHAGDRCPVCEQTIAVMPPAGVIADLADARERVRGTRDAAQRAAETRAAAEAELVATTRDLDALTDRLSTAPELDAVVARLAEIERCRVAARDAVAAEESARRDEAAARVARDRLDQAAESRRREYRSARDALVAVGLTPPPETDDLGGSWTALAAWAAAERAAVAAALRAARAAEADARAAVSSRLTALADDGRGLGLSVEGAPPLAELLGALAAEVRVVEYRRDTLDAEIKERAELEQAVAARAADAEVAAELARLLDASHFERWLVTEALSRLVADGSARLFELSSGRYSFVTDGRDFQVVDHTQADERRSVRTLSGGETFQASLALALALSEQLAELAPGVDHRLGSIFLDEGFGTLDADTLETVAGAIENLGAGDRMVGIVTHVPELAGRMPVQFRVSRRGGSATVERVDG
ncbi:MAG: AAA family ATPase [Acidimicrobiia bacterium]